MQVYKYMDIGSAKVTPEEMEGVPHHLIDCLSPSEPFHVVRFQEMAKKAMEEIYERGHLPIVTGGTGFYIQALLNDIDFTENEADDSYRKELEETARQMGAEYLHEKLKEIDPVSYEKIPAGNVKRVIRALEFYKMTGTPISVHNEIEKQKESPYTFAYVILNRDRSVLYDRIEMRIDQMLEMGLIEEVRRLKEMGYSRKDVSMQGLGYKEILDYLDGLITLEEAIYILKRDTRHFAKRQLTWFRREKNTDWIEMDGKEEETILLELEQILRNRGIINE